MGRKFFFQKLNNCQLLKAISLLHATNAKSLMSSKAAAQLNTHGLDEFCAPENFQMRIRIANTNITGNRQIRYSLTEIAGIGRSTSLTLLKQANIAPHTMGGYMTEEQIETLEKVVQAPEMPEYYRNSLNVRKTGERVHNIGVDILTHWRQNFDAQLRLNRHRAIRSKLGLRNRGQRTKSNGRNRR